MKSFPNSICQCYPVEIFYKPDDCSSFDLCVFTAIGLDTCPEPQTPTYGIKVGDRYMVGDVVMFQCEQGYSLQVKAMCCVQNI